MLRQLLIDLNRRRPRAKGTLVTHVDLLRVLDHRFGDKWSLIIIRLDDFCHVGVLSPELFQELTELPHEILVSMLGLCHDSIPLF